MSHEIDELYAVYSALAHAVRSAETESARAEAALEALREAVEEREEMRDQRNAANARADAAEIKLAALRAPMRDLTEYAPPGFLTREEADAVRRGLENTDEGEGGGR